MDSDCLSLLPSICEVLADPNLTLPDDTSLEKLLDWFKEELSQNDGHHLTQHQPSLLQFLYNVTQSDVIDPSVFSFSLKLAGLLAAKQSSYSLLEDRGVLVCLFEPDNWHEPDLWKNASVRCGWLQAVWNMLQHQRAMDFFCRNGLIKLVFHLQNDESLFICSLTIQILVHILNSLSNRTESLEPSSDLTSVTMIITHVAGLLSSEKQAVILLGLRLLAVALNQCRGSLREKLWKHVLEPLEVLIKEKGDFLTRPIMTVLQAAARTPLFIEPESRVEALMEVMLFSRNVSMSVQCAALILQLENCPEVLKRKATDIILLPLLCVSASRESEELNGHNSHLDNELSQRVSCVSLLTESLSSIAELINKKSLEVAVIHQITSSLTSLLRTCLGHRTADVMHRSSVHLIGCCKVQRCALDTLGNISVYQESLECNQEVLTVFLEYLQSPDPHATVLKKAHEAILKWFSICSPSPDLWKAVSIDLFPVLKKHVCDVRWEVRDSTLEFIAQLGSLFKGNNLYNEAFHAHDMFSVLVTSLSDAESYVQASAVAALGQAAVFTDLKEEAITHLLTVLAQDGESFPRRAAMKVFTSWLKNPSSCPTLEPVLSSVLSLGSSDFDWEVKVHMLELADVLIEKSFSRCDSGLSGKSRLSQAQDALTAYRLLGLLLQCLFDCDRPVCQKACALLLKLRLFMRENCSTESDDLVLEICQYSWGKEVLHRYQKKHLIESSCGDKELSDRERKESGLDWPKAMSLCQIFEVLDLEEREQILLLSSDHVINSPRSLMEDILSLAQHREENVIDCY